MPPRLPDVDPLPPMSPRERIARGRAARDRLPLAAHARWDPSSRFADPVAILEQQARTRDPALVPLRHERMLASPFAFFRGGAAIMAADLATTPITGLRCQLCGDAHLLNFGLFDSPERLRLFDINDFDETLAGPWEWDVKRLAASIEVAGLDLGFHDDERRRAVLACVRQYRQQMGAFAEQSNLEVWYARLDVEAFEERLSHAKHRADAKKIEHDLRKGLKRNHLTAFSKMVESTGGEARFVNKPPLLVPVEELLDDDGWRRYVEVMRQFLGRYRSSLSTHVRHLLDEYRYVHLARKVVGVGSVGTRAWVVLMVGRDAADPLILQLKEAQRSVLEPYAGPFDGKSKGRRVVEGQRLIQAAADPLLGWYRLVALDGRRHDFYVRQLWDGKASIDVTQLSPSGLTLYAETCGWSLARAHARTGMRISIAAYLGESDRFDKAVADFAAIYADVNRSDHVALAGAVEEGRLSAATSV